MATIKEAGAAVAVIGTAYALSWGAMFGLDTKFYPSKGDLREQQNTVHVDQEQLDAIEEGIVRQYGRNCLRLIATYSNGAPAELGFDTSVSNIANSPTQECGSSAAQVAQNLNSYQQAESNLSSDQQYLATVRKSPDVTTTGALEEAAKHAAIVDGVILGGIVFALL